ncbi:hypothetical protein BO78DRAFT_86661 [Aspergillus sclerotiicarbonarius CBS 121057]|uniref:Uncharacterized protein n=1 Tax=Aspergillus sclerotiicarbonarius (strain CBS 121057 / IBT 28362) TaxID=1448318 RepID=A0A319EBM8_ASPSB|nr:hypothetical protein BO78DRAFT_86661 [Aspergillus sclerotiicarbonarius CBS 121057]
MLDGVDSDGWWKDSPSSLGWASATIVPMVWMDYYYLRIRVVGNFKQTGSRVGTWVYRC